MSHSAPVVGDVMTQPVVALGLAATFKEIVESMQKWQVGALPVMAGDGRVVGVVSEADLLATEAYRDLPPAMGEPRPTGEVRKAGAATAADLMTTPAISVRADATLAQAARAMARRRLKRLPVVDGESHLVGIVSRSDLLKVFLRSDEEIAEEVRAQVISPLFPLGRPTVRAEVDEGVVTFTGWFRDATLVPLAARMARAVEGVVDVGFRLDEPEPLPGGGPGEHRDQPAAAHRADTAAVRHGEAT